MDFAETAEHRDLRAAVAAIASGFGPQYYAQPRRGAHALR